MKGMNDRRSLTAGLGAGAGGAADGARAGWYARITHRGARMPSAAAEQRAAVAPSKLIGLATPAVTKFVHIDERWGPFVRFARD